MFSAMMLLVSNLFFHLVEITRYQKQQMNHTLLMTFTNADAKLLGV